MTNRTYTATGVARDEGTVVLFDTAEGPQVAVDHRMAKPLADAIAQAGPLTVQVEPWQVIGTVVTRDFD